MKGLALLYASVRGRPSGPRAEAGKDDVLGADFFNPPLTTIASPIEEAGQVAVTMLLGQLTPRAGATVQNPVILPSHLVVQASTGPAPNATAPRSVVA